MLSEKIRCCSLCNYDNGKKQTSTLFAYKLSKNSQIRLKFLLKQAPSVFELGGNNYWTALNSFWITRNFVTLADWQAISFKMVDLNVAQMVKFQKIKLNEGRSWWNLRWSLSRLWVYSKYSEKTPIILAETWQHFVSIFSSRFVRPSVGRVVSQSFGWWLPIFLFHLFYSYQVI